MLEAEQIASNPNVKGYDNLDELFKTFNVSSQ